MTHRPKSLLRVAAAVSMVAVTLVDQRDSFSANAPVDVEANLIGTLTIQVVDTLDCGTINFLPATNCNQTLDRSGSQVLVTSSGLSTANVTFSGPATLDGPEESFDVTVQAFTSNAAATVLPDPFNLDVGGSSSFWIFPTTIAGLNAATSAGIYFGSTDITVTGTP